MSDVIASVGSAILSRLFGQRLERRRLRSGKYRCALRVIEGSHAGLDHRWSIEKAVVGPGTLAFRGRTVEVRYLSDAPRDPTTREKWGSLGPEFVVFRALTPHARIEMGVVRDQEREVLDRLRPTEL